MNMTYKKFRGRYLVVVAFSVGCWALLVSRIFFIQVVDAKSMATTIEGQFERRLELPPLRGNFYDRYGNKLTDNVEQYSFAARIADVHSKDEVASLFAKHFPRSKDYYLKRLNGKHPYVYLERNIAAKRCAELMSSTLPEGIEIESTVRRYYSYGEVAAPLMGLVGTDNHGLTGLEEQYDDMMSGTPGWRVIGSDGHGKRRIRGDFEQQDPVNGYDCYLTLDMDIQVIVEEELRKALKKHDADQGMAVLVNPETAEILAMASLPGFNPNSRGTIHPDALTVHPIMSTFEPGSTFKIVGASACLEGDHMDPGEKIYCEEGRFKVMGITISDHKPYGTLTFAEVIQNSSNIGIIKATDRLKEAELFNFARRYGFSEKTGVTYKGEASGQLKNYTRWSGISKSEISIGYEVSVTALQLAMAYSAVANGGYLMKPQLVRGIQTPEQFASTIDTMDVIRRVASGETMATMRGILRQAVETGTGNQAYLPYLDIAGKTGTAKKFKNGEYVKEYVASFASFFPADNPVYTLVVVIDNPRQYGYTGGMVAAPVSREIYRRIHNLRRVDIKRPAETEKPTIAEKNKPLLKLSGELLSTAMPVLKADVSKTEMPDLRKHSMRAALQILSAFGASAEVSGNGRVIRQSPSPGTLITADSDIKLFLSE